MTTQYKHQVIIAVPANLIPKANSLACLLGETAADLHTFNSPSYIDYSNNKYAVAAVVVKDGFVEPTMTGVLPDDPDHTSDLTGYSRIDAEEAFATLNQPGGIMMYVNESWNDVDAVNKKPQEVFKEWGVIPNPFNL